MFHLAMDFCLK